MIKHTLAFTLLSTIVAGCGDQFNPPPREETAQDGVAQNETTQGAPQEAPGDPTPLLTGPASIDWATQGPFEFIASLIRLDERNVKTVLVRDAPRDWIRREHLDLLVHLLDSTEPCASVGSTRSSFVDFSGEDQKSSTVGHEAAYLIESYRHGLFPKYAVNTSADLELDREALRRWWAGESKR